MTESFSHVNARLGNEPFDLASLSPDATLADLVRKSILIAAVKAPDSKHWDIRLEPALVDDTSSLLTQNIHQMEVHQSVHGEIDKVSVWVKGLNVTRGSPVSLDLSSISGVSLKSLARVDLKIAPSETFDVSTGTSEVRVVTMTGKTILVPCELHWTVEALKMKIQMLEGIPPDQQRIVFCGKQLEDDRTLCSYGIQRDSRMSLVLRMRGGMFVTSSGRQDYATLNHGSDPSLEQSFSSTVCLVETTAVVRQTGREFRSVSVQTHPKCSFRALMSLLRLELDPKHAAKLSKRELRTHDTSLLTKDARSRVHLRLANDRLARKRNADVRVGNRTEFIVISDDEEEESGASTIKSRSCSSTSRRQ